MSLYQQLSGEENEKAQLQFKPNYFDLIVIDECHRGSADAFEEQKRIVAKIEELLEITKKL